MSKIERRHHVVSLVQGGYEQKLADLTAEAMAALRAEEVGAKPRRAGTKSEANEKAREYDRLLAEAEETAVKVWVWAIGYLEWSAIADDHPPREDEQADKRHGVNMKTFPHALLLASLPNPVDPETQEPREFESLEAQLSEGREILNALGLSRLHYAKLESAAWNVNVGDDALPKVSLAYLLQQAREPASKQQPGSE